MKRKEKILRKGKQISRRKLVKKRDETFVAIFIYDQRRSRLGSFKNGLMRQNK